MDRAWSFKEQNRAQRILKRTVVRPQEAVQPGFVEYLIPLRNREQITLTGRLQIRIIRGTANVWGARLLPSETFHWVTTPTWNAAPTLVASTHSQTKKGAKVQAHPWREADDILKLLEERTWPVVVCLKLPRPTVVVNPDHVPNPSQKRTPEDKAIRKALYEACLPEEDSRRYRVHPAWASLAERFGELVSSGSTSSSSSSTAEGTRKPPVMMVLGDPNVGKSSCCRYFLNAFLSQHGEAYLLDTDLGQPEFTTPGLVSLLRIRGPLLNFSTTAADAVINEQQKFCSTSSSSSSSSSAKPCPAASSASSSVTRVERVASFFVGSSSPSVDPLLYARSVRAAMDEYIALCDANPAGVSPLVVNTHGWMYGLGLQLIHAALRTCQPQLILRIGVSGVLPKKDEIAAQSEGAAGSEESSMMLKSKRSVLARTGPLSTDLSGDCARSKEELPTVIVDLECLVSGKVANPKRREKGKLNPATARWLRFTTYFKPQFDSLRMPSVEPMQRFFGSMPKTRLPLESLQFGTLHSEIGASGVISTFTGNVGFLCALRDCSTPPVWKYKEEDQALDASDGDVTSLTVVKVGPESVACCYAVLFVHSFDLANGDLICYTPAPVELLEKADTLLGGDMPWAPHNFQNEAITGHEGTATGSISPLHPYTSSWTLEGLSSGSRAPTMRPNFRRKLVQEGKPGAQPPAKVIKAK